MNRRSFFKKASAFVAGCALGIGALKETALTLTKAGPVEALESIPNPAYVDAECEMEFYCLSPYAFEALRIGPPPKEDKMIPIIYKRSKA